MVWPGWWQSPYTLGGEVNAGAGAPAVLMDSKGRGGLQRPHSGTKPPNVNRGGCPARAAHRADGSIGSGCSEGGCQVSGPQERRSPWRLRMAQVSGKKATRQGQEGPSRCPFLLASSLPSSS